MTAFALSGGRQIPKLCMPLVENYLQITTHELKQTCCGKNSNHCFLWQHFFRCSFSLLSMENIKRKINSSRVNRRSELFRQSIIANCMTSK
jgi:hypothetical protein